MDYKKLWIGLMEYLNETEDRVTKKSLSDRMKDDELNQMRVNSE